MYRDKTRAANFTSIYKLVAINVPINFCQYLHTSISLHDDVLIGMLFGMISCNLNVNKHVQNERNSPQNYKMYKNIFFFIDINTIFAWK